MTAFAVGFETSPELLQALQRLLDASTAVQSLGMVNVYDMSWEDRAKLKAQTDLAVAELTKAQAEYEQRQKTI